MYCQNVYAKFCNFANFYKHPIFSNDYYVNISGKTFTIWMICDLYQYLWIGCLTKRCEFTWTLNFAWYDVEQMSAVSSGLFSSEKLSTTTLLSDFKLSRTFMTIEILSMLFKLWSFKLTLKLISHMLFRMGQNWNYRTCCTVRPKPPKKNNWHEYFFAEI